MRRPDPPARSGDERAGRRAPTPYSQFEGEPLDLAVAPGDHGEALGIRLDAEAMRLGQHAQSLDGPLLCRWLSSVSAC